MPRRSEGDSRQKKAFVTYREGYDTRQRTDEIRRRAEQQEKERAENLKSKYNLLFAELHQLKIKRIDAVHNDTRLNSRYDHFIRVPSFQDIIFFSQESHPAQDIMSSYRTALNEIRDIKSNIAEYSDLRDKYINDCQEYNGRAGNHNRNACQKNKVESIDIEGDYKLEPFTPSDLDLSLNGLRSAVKDLRNRNGPQ
jgi:hypothetical protein